MKNLMKCFFVAIIVATGFSNSAFAGSNNLQVRDTVIPDTVKTEIGLVPVNYAQNDEVTWTKIKASDLPEAIVKAVNEKYEGYTIEEAYKGDNDQYKLILKKDENKVIAIFDKDGKFIEESKE